MNRYKNAPESTPSAPLPGLRRTVTQPLTDAAIRGLKPGQKMADGVIRPPHGSLKVRRRQTAAGSVVEFLFSFQHAGRTRVATIGRYGKDTPNAITLTQARDEARRLQGLVQAGEDPLAKREIARATVRVEQAATLAKVREAGENTLGALCDEYVRKLRGEGKAMSARDAECLFRVHLRTPFPHLTALPAAAIEPAHITHILARMVGPAAQSKGKVKGRTALKLRSYLHAAYRFGIGAALDPMAGDAAAGFGLTMNPVGAVPATKMAAKYKVAGKRALSPDELRVYLLHVAALPSAMTRVALMLQIALGGQRFQQMLRAEWKDLRPASWHEGNTEVDGRTLTLYDPKGRRAQPRPHALPVAPDGLAQPVLAELATITPAPGPIFASGEATMRHETLSAAVADISAAMVADGTASEPFRASDIRRTCETLMAERLRISKDTRAQLLSHGLGGVQDVHYDVGTHLDTKGEALKTWGNFLADLAIGAPTPSNVVPLHAAALLAAYGPAS
ncbi:MAG: integrase family protein [Proteobacteria bacterium]|nr:integrase family protein [Pseudomonadota bacterium]